MTMPNRTVRCHAAITGNVAAQEMVVLNNANNMVFGGHGIDAGVFIKLDTATTVKVKIEDAEGRILHSDTSAVTANSEPDVSAKGVHGPLKVTTTEISDAEHTLDVYVDVRQ